MARFFAVGLLVLTITEIALFIKVGQWIGVFPTLALIILAAIAGMMLLRLQGLAVLSQLRNNMSSGRMPGRTIADTMMIGLAGMLLIIPGFLSDAVALALLLPPVRNWIYGGLARRVKVVETATYRNTTRGDDPRLNDGTIDLDEDDYRPR
ncbi:FxsA family protein [Devosia sp. 2618]|uniref:FxsA family protein n=1 Tax=Devosia sp. 2618 TaxID=3156454 RepID=UPI003392E580